MSGDVDLVAHHMFGANQQVLHLDILFHGIGLAVETVLAVPGQVKGRLPERLARDGAKVDHDPANHLGSFDEPDPFVKLGGLNRSALSGRTGADHKYVVVVLRHVCTAFCMTREGSIRKGNEADRPSCWSAR